MTQPVPDDDRFNGLQVIERPDLTDGDTPPTSDDPTCKVCGVGLTYSGRGRKPTLCDEHKRSSGTPRSAGAARGSSQVETALASMDALYNMACMLLLPISPEAATIVREHIPDAQSQNRVAFTGDPKLAKSVTQTAGKGGKGLFAVTQAALFGPAIMIGVKDLQSRTAARQAATRQRKQPGPTPTQQQTNANADAGYVDPVDQLLGNRRTTPGTI